MATRKTPNTANYKIVKIDSQFTQEGFSSVDFDLVEQDLKPEDKKLYPSTVYMICENKKLIMPFTIGTTHFICFKTVMGGKVFADDGLRRDLNAQSVSYTAEIIFFPRTKK